MDIGNVETIKDFDKWKSTLHKVIHFSEKLNLSEDTITDIGKKVGDFLMNNVETENKEQKLLKQLWEVGTQEERHSLTHMLIKMIEKEHHGIQ
ncbi:DUF3243 domain-containing protein [Mycoplasmatota bacterium]|nr:DUF3243 domain-containing protein [Mycoplasmatota bacterium]